MKTLFKVFALASILALLTAIPLRAEEKVGSINTPLSSTTLSGYMYSSASLASVPPSAYTGWLIQKQQQALLAFNRERILTHNFLGNPFYLQFTLEKYHLVWFPGSNSGISSQVIPPPSGDVSYMPLVPIATIFHPAGYAYYDSPSILAGPYGTYLLPDNTAWRVTRPPGVGFGFNIPKGNNHPPHLPHPPGLPLTNSPVPVLAMPLPVVITNIYLLPQTQPQTNVVVLPSPSPVIIQTPIYIPPLDSSSHNLSGGAVITRAGAVRGGLR
jgi:hypothetical protein